MATVCARCEAPLVENVLEGLCPRCLLLRAVPLERIEEAATTSAGAFTSPSLPDLAPLFPHLEILELLGQGGMGAVYKARQIKLDRLVALKILPPGTAHDPSFAERFTREARTLARLNHPHIVAVHDFGDVNGLYYLVMEFVEGVNLRQALAAGKLEPQQALVLVSELCSAMQYAHESGVVHRDIKPENILLDCQGRVKVADFGLAKLVGQTQAPGRLTATGQALGTPHYMAPEQWEKPLLVDHRADIYSLGVVFYELLTGELPLGKFAAPSQKAGVDTRLDHIVLRAIEKYPEQRYQKMSEMKTAVEAVGQLADSEPDEPAESFPPGWLLEPQVVLPLVLFFLVLFVVTGRQWNLPWTVLLTIACSSALLVLALYPLYRSITASSTSDSPADEDEEDEANEEDEEDEGEEEEEEEADEPFTLIPGLTAQDEGLRRLLETAAADSDELLSVLPNIDNTLLAAARNHCRVAPDDRILGVLDFSGGEGEAALLFGSMGLYWRNAEDTPHPGTDSLSYTGLPSRRFVNHGDVVYLGNEQFICPQPDDSGVDCENLVSLLYRVRDAMAPRPA